MGYIIINRDEDDMGGLRSNMRRTMMRHTGTMPMMRHNEDYDSDKMYELGFKHGWEDAAEEHFRRMRDSRGRFI